MNLSELIKSINAVADLPSDINEEDRSNLLAASQRLSGKLESPRDAAYRTVFAPHQAIALRLAIDMKLFDAAAKVSAEGGQVELEHLSSQTAADPLLVVRVMRFLVGMGIFEEAGEGIFASTPLSRVYMSNSPYAQAVIHMTAQNEIISCLPSYFEKHGYKSPGDAYHGPFQYARDTDLHCFDWLATKPRLQHAFNVAMEISRSNSGVRWFDFFPVEAKLRVESPSATLLVDIGGGVGHDLIALKHKYPSLPGKLVVQDIPVVIDSIKELPEGITATKHDFFKPQPVKGAKAYYLGHVLHDWPDKQAHVILDKIREAMGPESVLLINESILPGSKVPLRTASVDLIMMANFSSLERTQAQFEALLSNAGFDLVKIWTAPDTPAASGALLEAVPKKT